MALAESIRKSRTWVVWGATNADWRQILKMVQEQFDELLPDHIESATASARDQVSFYQARLDEIASSHSSSQGQIAVLRKALQDATKSLEKAEIAAARASLLDLSITDSNGHERTVTGDSNEIADYMETHEVATLLVSAPSGSIRRRNITLSGGKRSGLSLRVASDDARWGAAAFAQLEERIDRHAQRWGFIRRPWLTGPLFGAVTVLPLYSVLDRIADEQGSPATLVALFWLLLWLVALFSVVVAPALVVRWVPAFEVFSQSSKSRARALVGVLGSAALALALGVIGNVVSGLLLKP